VFDVLPVVQVPQSYLMVLHARWASSVRLLSAVQRVCVMCYLVYKYTFEFLYGPKIQL
jgi:hypothetical protein